MMICFALLLGATPATLEVRAGVGWDSNWLMTRKAGLGVGIVGVGARGEMELGNNILGDFSLALHGSPAGPSIRDIRLTSYIGGGISLAPHLELTVGLRPRLMRTLSLESDGGVLPVRGLTRVEWATGLWGALDWKLDFIDLELGAEADIKRVRGNENYVDGGGLAFLGARWMFAPGFRLRGRGDFGAARVDGLTVRNGFGAPTALPPEFDTRMVDGVLELDWRLVDQIALALFGRLGGTFDNRTGYQDRHTTSAGISLENVHTERWGFRVAGDWAVRVYPNRQISMLAPNAEAELIVLVEASVLLTGWVGAYGTFEGNWITNNISAVVSDYRGLAGLYVKIPFGTED